MQESEVELNGRVRQFADQLDKDIRITQMNLTDKALTRSSIAAKWLRYGFQEQTRKRNMTKRIDQLRKAFTDAIYQKKKSAIENMTITQSMIKIDVQKCLKKSSEYHQILQQMKEQEQVIRFISQAKQIVHAFSYDVRNSIDIMKIQNGN